MSDLQIAQPQIAQPLAHYAAWRRAGDFIYLSGVIAVDPARSLVVGGYADLSDVARQHLKAHNLGETGEFSTDAKEGPIYAQSYFVLDRIRSTVQAAGGQMSDVFKLVQYFKNLDQFPHYSRVRKLFFSGEPPASTVVEVSAMLPSADILVEVEATAYLPLRT